MDSAPALDRLRQRIRGFHADQSGQSIVYLVLVMFLLASFAFMVVNSGALLHDKMQVQSAADSAVMSGSTWMVRTLNLNSMMNILMATCMAEAIYMKGVYWTALTALMLSSEFEAFWLGVCLTTGSCNPSNEVVTDTSELLPILTIAADQEDFLWDVIETLSDTEAGVHAALPQVGQLESVRMAMMNGAGFGAMYPPTVPEQEGELQDLCECVRDGMPGGYSEAAYSNWGTLATALDEIQGFQYAGDVRNLGYDLVSGFFGLDGPLWGELQIPYQTFWTDTAPYHFTNLMHLMAVWSRYSVMCGGSLPPESVPFEVPAAWWCNSCEDNEVDVPDPGQYLGWAFASLGAENPLVRPMMLVDDWEQRQDYWGFASKSPADVQSRFIPDVFANPYGDATGMVTVAQARIYNPHSDGGMFSPHWRTHLAPVELGTGTAEAAVAWIASSGIAAEGESAAVAGLLTVVEPMAGPGAGGLLAH